MLISSLYQDHQYVKNNNRVVCSNNGYIIWIIKEFAKIIHEQGPLKFNEKYLSYDLESLITNVAVHKRIEYVINGIYVENKLPKLCSKLIFKRLLLKLTAAKTFMLNLKFYKQVDECSMGGPLSVILSNIYMTRTERKVVEPTKLHFYKRFIDDIINKWYK